MNHLKLPRKKTLFTRKNFFGSSDEEEEEYNDPPRKKQKTSHSTSLPNALNFSRSPSIYSIHSGENEQKESNSNNLSNNPFDAKSHSQTPLPSMPDDSNQDDFKFSMNINHNNHNNQNNQNNAVHLSSNHNKNTTTIQSPGRNSRNFNLDRLNSMSPGFSYVYLLFFDNV